MTGRLPVLKAGQVMTALRKAGFMLVRINGSHHVFDHNSDPNRTVIVPVHAARYMKTGALRAVIRQAGLTVE